MASPEIDTARAIAEQAHRGQVDKIGEPYIQHPEMVASLVQRLPWFRDLDEPTQQDAVVAAWLHDVLEDTGETAESLIMAGVSEQAIAAVVALTRTEDVPADDYYANIDRQPLSRLVKVADIASNLAPDRVARLDDATRVRLAAKYSHALDQLQVDPSVITDLYAPGRSDETTKWTASDDDGTIAQIERTLTSVAKAVGGMVLPYPRAGVATKRVVLKDSHDSDGSQFEVAVIEGDGTVRVTGIDRGRRVSGFFGPSISSYDWVYVVPHERVALLITELGGSPDSDVLDLLANFFAKAGSSEMAELLRASPVGAEFDNWMS